MNIEDVKKELGEYIKDNKQIVAKAFYSEDIALNKHCKTITAVKGKYPSWFSIVSHVLQPFSTSWSKVGEASIMHKMLQNHHVKVNFSIIPAEILPSWLAELYTEGKTLETHPISKHIMDDLMGKVIDDVDLISQTGDTDSTLVWEKSFDGIDKKVQVALADTEHPAFRIPLTAITSVNILDEFKKFEKGIPKRMRKKVKKLFCSSNLAMEYQDQYEQQYGTKVTFTDGDAFKTPLTKMEIVPLDNLNDTTIFATVEGNMARLIDVFNKPEITSLQIQDYELKIFMESHLGYDFSINELAYIAVFDGSPKGLNNANLNGLLYPGENLTVTP